ncbi:MAG TPA: hypothetical protein VKH82_00110 [Candidatus Binatia bacterium]|nr:hypothetical protein [Candidatus Binatia bacterium]
MRMCEAGGPKRPPVGWPSRGTSGYSPGMRPRVLVVLLLLARASLARACPELPVLADAPNPFDLQYGATNVNAALGSGRLTAAFSRCGELTVLKWPGPSYHNQLDYLSSNAVDARTLPHFGALDTQGAFPGIAYRLRSGRRGFSWLRDDGWSHVQHYSADTSDVLVDEAVNATLGLRVTAWSYVLPDRNVLVDHYEVRRERGSPVTGGTLIFYTNLQPTLARLPYFNFADWALDFQTDFVAAYDSRERAVLHFMPMQTGAPPDYGLVNPILRDPPKDARRLRRQVRRMLDGVSQPGVYIALGARRRDDGVQVGFDDAPICSHQSTLAERTIQAFNLPPSFVPVARSIFKCDAIVKDPGGPLGACRTQQGWRWQAESAFADAEDGRLGGSPIAACQANAAVARRLRFRHGVAEATFDIAIGATKAEAYALLRSVRAESPDAQRAATESWWADFLAPARLPDTDDATITAFAKRSLIAARTATDDASGAIVASVATQSPYGADWPRDGAFINHALDLAGYTDLVSRHNRFYVRVQRKTPAPWSLFYDFGTCDPANPTYPACVPAGTFETNYYADPDAVVPANPISFEIDEAGLGVWTMWDHLQYLHDDAERAAYLADVCPAIVLGVTNLAACRDPENGLQCMANEDDNIPLSQGLQGAETVLLALKTGMAAAAACGVDAATATGWQTRADELSRAIRDHFLDPGPPAHFTGDRSGWLLWPVEYFAAGDPLADSQARWLQEHSIDPILTRTAPSGAYDAENLVVRGKRFRAIGDTAGLAALQEQVRFFVRELTTPGTLHMGEAYGRYQLDVNGDGVAPDYVAENDVPHIWEHSYLYIAAMTAFGSR